CCVDPGCCQKWHSHRWPCSSYRFCYGRAQKNPCPVLALPVVFRKSASTPVAVFSKPRMLLLSAKLPVAVLLVPSVLLESALAPIAVFATPVVLFTSASSPKNVLPPLRSQSCRQTARACGGSTKQASTNAVRNKPCREGDPVIEFFVTEVLVFIRRIVPFPRLINCASVGLNGERSCREKRPLPDRKSVV